MGSHASRPISMITRIIAPASLAMQSPRPDATNGGPDHRHPSIKACEWHPMELSSTFCRMQEIVDDQPADRDATVDRIPRIAGFPCAEQDHVEATDSARPNTTPTPDVHSAQPPDRAAGGCPRRHIRFIQKLWIVGCRAQRRCLHARSHDVLDCADDLPDCRSMFVRIHPHLSQARSQPFE